MNNKIRANYSLGCKPDPRDLRDIPMGLVLPEITPPISVDYTFAMSAVRNQGNEGTCVGFATVVGVKEYQDKKEYKKTIKLSPRYLYSLCKKFDGAPDEEGTYPRIAMKILLNYGTCPEKLWPYKPFQKDAPKKDADKKAKIYRIKAYARIKSVIEMKRSLAINGPFIAGVRVFSNWFTKKVAKSGIISMPKPDDQLQGGHAICIVGYDDNKKIFKFKNSWSKSWADNGYGYLPYQYLSKYCSDAWSATDLIENPKALDKSIEASRITYEKYFKNNSFCLSCNN